VKPEKGLPMAAVQNIPTAPQLLTRQVNSEVIIAREKARKKTLKVIRVWMGNKNVPMQRMVPLHYFLTQLRIPVPLSRISCSSAPGNAIRTQIIFPSKAMWVGCGQGTEPHTSQNVHLTDVLGPILCFSDIMHFVGLQPVVA